MCCDICSVLRFLAWPQPGEITCFCHRLPLSTCYSAIDNKRRVFHWRWSRSCVLAWIPAPRGSGTFVFGCLKRLKPLGLELQWFFFFFLLWWGNLIAFILFSAVSQPGTVKWVALDRNANIRRAWICSENVCRNVYFSTWECCLFCSISTKLVQAVKASSSFHYGASSPPNATTHLLRLWSALQDCNVQKENAQ